MLTKTQLAAFAAIAILGATIKPSQALAESVTVTTTVTIPLTRSEDMSKGLPRSLGRNTEYKNTVADAGTAVQPGDVTDEALSSSYPDELARVISGMDTVANGSSYTISAGSFIGADGTEYTFSENTKQIADGTYSEDSGATEIGQMGSGLAANAVIYIYGLYKTDGSTNSAWSTDGPDTFTPSGDWLKGPVVGTTYATPTALASFAAKSYGVDRLTILDSPQQVVDGNPSTANDTAETVYAPPNSVVKFSGTLTGVSGTAFASVKETWQADSAPSHESGIAATGAVSSGFHLSRRVDGSSQVNVRGTLGTSTIKLYAEGWYF